MKNTIETLIQNKQFITWSDACKMVLNRSFKPTDIKELIKTFNEAVTGSDALLVDGECKYSYRAPLATHTAWLKAKGYENVPEVKGQPEKKAKDSRLFSPTKAVSNDTAKEVADLKAQLAALVTAMTQKATG
jgi:hypothetical protein